ncbi:MAG: YdcF family protein [Gammaproteobacteria bacterium]|nr:YdcF family protein [Gammaproteobacteria bacterium]
MLNKILPIFFSPLVVILALLVVGIWTRRRRWCAAAGALLLLASLPVFADWAFSAAQGNAKRQVAASLPRVDAVVVLGGAVEYVTGVNGTLVPEWNDAVDRLFGGLELMRAERSSRLILSAGAQPPRLDTPSEGEILMSFARDFGVDRENIVVSPNAINTEEEARVIRSIQGLGHNRIILVSSALHLPRATMIFEAAGFDVIPYPVDIRVLGAKNAIESWVPTPSALGKVGLVVRELIGRFYYRVMISLGWVSL